MTATTAPTLATAAPIRITSIVARPGSSRRATAAVLLASSRRPVTTAMAMYVAAAASQPSNTARAAGTTSHRISPATTPTRNETATRTREFITCSSCAIRGGLRGYGTMARVTRWEYARLEYRTPGAY